MKLEKTEEKVVRIKGVEKIEMMIYSHNIRSFDFWQLIIGVCLLIWLRPLCMGYMKYAIITAVLTILCLVTMGPYGLFPLFLLTFYTARDFPLHRINKLRNNGYIEVID